MKVAIIGGHFSPAYAVLQELKPNHEVIFIGRKYSLEGDSSVSYEYQVIQNEGIPFYTIRAFRLQRTLTKHTIPSLIKFPVGFLDAQKLLKKERPHIILSFGGYLSLPVCLAAKSLGIPIVIHEQTQEAGLANKIIGKISDKICVSFKNSQQYFSSGKTVVTGNPIRRALFTIKKTLDVPKDLPLLYVTGGSTGAHAINEIVKESLSVLLSSFVIIHQTGESHYHDFEALEQKKHELSEELTSRYIVKKFVYDDEIGWIFNSADIIIGRAGINTISEIIALNKKCILIPLPHGQKGEQLKNAKLAQEQGYGIYLDQNDLTQEKLLASIKSVLAMSLPQRSTSEVNSAQKIVSVLESVYDETKKK